jgi:hypothetical protein
MLKKNWVMAHPSLENYASASTKAQSINGLYIYAKSTYVICIAKSQSINGLYMPTLILSHLLNFIL